MSLLAIESSSEHIKAAIIKKTLKGYKIKKLIKFERENDYEILTRTEVAIVKSVIGKHPKNVVVVSPAIMVIEIFMNRDNVERMNNKQLKEAIKWEVEQYVSDNIVGYEICDVYGSNIINPDKVRIWVSVIPKDEFDLIKNNLLKEGLKLKNIYPSDVCFPIVKKRKESEGGLIACNINERNIKLSFVKDKKIVKTMEIPAGSENINFNIKHQTTSEIKEIILDAIEQIISTENILGFSSYINILAKYGQINNENMKVILSGVGANSGTILKFLQSFIPFDINAVEMLTHKSIYGEEIVLAEFVNVYGAAIRQFSKDKKIKTIGINDIPTILEYIKNKSEVIPITILCVSVTVLGAYYCFIKYKAPKINKIIAQLEAQKDEYDNARSTYDSLNDRVLEIEKNTRLYNDKIHFLSEEIGIKREYLVNLLRGISKFSESGLMIQTLKPDNMDKMLFNIDGESYNISSINTLISGLQLQSWCAYAKVININKTVYVKEEIIEEDKSYDENIIQDEDDYNSDKETKNDNTIRTEVVSYKFNIKILLN